MRDRFLVVMTLVVSMCCACSGDPGAAEMSDAGGQSGGAAGSGRVVITSFTADAVQGTFEAVLVPQGATTGSSLNVTNGVFDVSF